MSNLLSAVISGGYQNIALGRSGILNFINPDALTRCVWTEKIYKPPYASIYGGRSNTFVRSYSLLGTEQNYTYSIGSYSTAFGYNSIIK